MGALCVCVLAVWVPAYWVFVSEWHITAPVDLYAAVCYVVAGIARPAEVSARH
jgi:hypothetical protein